MAVKRTWVPGAVLFFAVFLLAAGCAKTEVSAPEETAPPAVVEEPVAEEPQAPAVEQPAETEAAAPVYGEEISEGRTHAPMLPVYFDFDKYNIRDDMKGRLEDDARFLLDHPEIRIEVQGNCDERGTNEYNLALGERRAKSIKDYLVNLGVAADRIETVSFGEERPLDPGHNEEAWAKNRRGDLVILK
ncbi:peptidoglycan-associated lipoprotein Pal [Dissulfurirhabdus thermomarina]|uniref:Peptidoglycan-associated lipoprotein n=2 Tax=Dissulfurirhabdus thermomarina TaxID=1765737 RepID=A0A6N9TMJ9_DISTH|nr:peptidoglycan-associated lipoprotein Pal [Dissulfurirhabdus thermomarina]NMX22762.1 peptidoglycan-associated lipoprotein Pal [Dissulfurirhabdus thermomarina]